VSDQQRDVELVVNPSTRIVHRAECFYAGIMQLNEPLPLEQWPDDARDQLRGCGNCEPPGWR
jgi:hypothetical protein